MKIDPCRFGATLLFAVVFTAGCAVETNDDAPSGTGAPDVVLPGTDVEALAPPGGGGTTNPCLVFPPVTPPQAGDVDFFFGCRGTSTYGASNVDTQIKGLAAQTDDKIVAVGETYDPQTNNHDVWVARFSSSGLIDTTFATGGVFSYDLTAPLGGAESAEAVLVQPDGSIVVGGGYWREDNAWRQGFLMRLTPNGALDATFGAGGVQKLETMTYVRALQSSNGVIVAAGERCTGFQNCVATIGRYAGTDGTPDPGFGTDGVRTTYYAGNSNARAYAAVASGSKVAIGGNAVSNNTAVNMGVARFSATGIDGTFGTNGVVGIDVAPSEAVRGMAAFGSGYVLAESLITAGGTEQFSVHRIDGFGSVISSFGQGGRVNDTFDGYGAGANATLLTPAQKIVAVGWARDSAYRQRIAVARMTSIGLDPTFSSDGNVTLTAGGHEAVGNAVVLQSTGRIVVGGTVRATSTSPRRAVLVRLHN